VSQINNTNYDINLSLSFASVHVLHVDSGNVKVAGELSWTREKSNIGFPVQGNVTQSDNVSIRDVDLCINEYINT